MAALPSSPEYPESTPLERVLDLLFPPICVGCRRIGRWVCDRCWQGTSWLLAHRCAGCGQSFADGVCSCQRNPRHAVDELCVVATFDGTAREAVHALKYEGRHAISGMMGRVMALAAQNVNADVVAGVPLHARRRRERGYDQADMLARSIARHLGRPHEVALKRIRYTTQQTRLDAPARQRNVEAAFRARHDMSGRVVLLVDDVYTTGATMREAARSLKVAGATRVVGVVFARAALGADVEGAPRR